MMKSSIIDKSMIEEFGSQIDSSNIRDAIYRITDIIEDSVLELSQTNNLITIQNVDIATMGNIFDTEILDADLNLFLTIKSAQIDLNSVEPMEKKSRILLNKVVAAWKNRKAHTRRAKRKAAKLAKKKDKTLTIQDLMRIKEKPYSILSLKDDIYQQLIERLTNTTVVYNYPSTIRILGREEFGCKINLIPAIKHDDGLKVWSTTKNKFKLINPEKAKSLLEEKNKKITEESFRINSKNQNSFYAIIRIFKNIYYNIYRLYDYSFIDSLIYGCPNSLFVSKSKRESSYNTFIKVLNYLTNTNLNSYSSIYNQNKTMTEGDEISPFKLKTFLKDINEFITNA